MPTIEEYVIFQLLQITQHQFTFRTFIILRIICKKLLEPVPYRPNKEGKPGPPMHLPPLPPPPPLWAGLTRIKLRFSGLNGTR